ncbi:MAG: hypothetical protein ACFFCS_12890 [Candidatus Hodarchaeota archaeon]
MSAKGTGKSTYISIFYGFDISLMIQGVPSLKRRVLRRGHGFSPMVRLLFHSL